MARKVIAVTLLGLLACAALASAEDMKKKDEYKGRQQLRDRKERDYKEDKDKKDKDKKDYKDPKPQPDNRDKPQLVRAPKMLYNTEMTLEVDNASFQAEGTNVGNSATLRMDLMSKGEKVGVALLSGISTFYEPSTGSFKLNSIMTIKAVSDKMEGTMLTAQGVVAWDGVNKQIVKGLDTLIITGGSGVADGADGTITLAGGEDTGVPRTLTLKISVPKAHKSESEDN